MKAIVAIIHFHYFLLKLAWGRGRKYFSVDPGCIDYVCSSAIFPRRDEPTIWVSSFNIGVCTYHEEF